MSRTPLPNAPPQGGREQTLGSPARRRLAGFSRTLRDNGFKIGLAETQDALALLGSPAAIRAVVAQAGLSIAVLCDAFGLGTL